MSHGPEETLLDKTFALLRTSAYMLVRRRVHGLGRHVCAEAFDFRRLFTDAGRRRFQPRRLPDGQRKFDECCWTTSQAWLESAVHYLHRSELAESMERNTRQRSFQVHNLGNTAAGRFSFHADFDPVTSSCLGRQGPLIHSCVREFPAKRGFAATSAIQRVEDVVIAGTPTFKARGYRWAQDRQSDAASWRRQLLRASPAG